MTEKVRILITDDHRMFSEGLKAMLMSKKNLSVPQLAESGEQALEMLEIDKFDLLITDINMPGISGIELTRLVKRKYPHSE
jgi:two-component system, NarL family, nitrate/nitrite response regulator NarL